MTDKNDIFSGDNPFQIFKRWLHDASKTEINDHDASKTEEKTYRERIKAREDKSSGRGVHGLRCQCALGGGAARALSEADVFHAPQLARVLSSP